MLPITYTLPGQIAVEVSVKVRRRNNGRVFKGTAQKIADAARKVRPDLAKYAITEVRYSSDPSILPVAIVERGVTPADLAARSGGPLSY